MLGGNYAVQVFYVVSGFSMSIIFNEKKKYNDVRQFYVSRLLKLYSTYYVVAVFALIVYLVHHILLHRANSFFDAYANMPSMWGWVAAIFNATIIMQDLTAFVYFDDTGPKIIGVDPGIRHVLFIDAMLLPQSWSIALEIYFYTLCPLVVRRTKLQVLLIGTSIAVFAILAHMDLSNVDPWSYRFFPSQLYLFLLGVLSHKIIYTKYVSKMRETGVFVNTVGAFTLLFVLFSDLMPINLLPTWKFAFVNLVFLALPMLYHISRRNGLDMTMGRLSYPAYLLHIVVYFVLNRVIGRLGGMDELYMAVFAVIATVAMSYFVDKWVVMPVDRFRYRFVRLGFQSRANNQ